MLVHLYRHDRQLGLTCVMCRGRLAMHAAWDADHAGDCPGYIRAVPPHAALALPRPHDVHQGS